jgi:putative MATE family efflux protein
MDRQQMLEKDRIGKLIWQFSLPAVAGMVVNALYNVVDRIFVGRGVGPSALSGIAVTMPLMMIMMALTMFVSIGAGARVSIKLGQKKKEDAQMIVGNALTLSLMISVVFSILGYIFMVPLLKAFGGQGESLNYAVQFTSIIIFTMIFQGILFTFNNIIRAEGNPMMALITMLIGAVINTILNPLFIFGLHLGVQGSALATLISQIVTSVWVFSYFIGKRSLLPLKLKNMVLNKVTVFSILSIGIAPFAMQLAMSLMISVSNHVFGTYGGNDAIAAVGLIGVISMLFNMPVIGIVQGIQPIIGYNYGAKQYNRVRKTLKLAIFGATLVCLTGFILVFFFNKQIMNAFVGNDADLTNLGSRAMQIALITLPLVGFQIVGGGYFSAVGKYKHSLLLNLSRQVLVLIPLLLILPRFFGLFGAIAAFPISDGISFALTFLFIMAEIGNLTDKHNTIQAAAAAIPAEA